MNEQKHKQTTDRLTKVLEFKQKEVYELSLLLKLTTDVMTNLDDKTLCIKILEHMQLILNSKIVDTHDRNIFLK